MENAYQRAVELVRAYAAATSCLKASRLCTKPRSVECLRIDDHDDAWGMTDKCLYRVDKGQCERFPGKYDAIDCTSRYPENATYIQARPRRT